MTRFDTLYGSRFLAATDLKAPVTATIERVTFEPFTRPGEATRTRCVLHFKGDLKPMVVNKTNAIILAAAYGKDFDKWIGKRVIVRAEPTVYAGKPTPGLRVQAIDVGDRITTGRPIVPPEPPPRDDMDDEIPW
jgi:hypothetical protein